MNRFIFAFLTEEGVYLEIPRLKVLVVMLLPSLDLQMIKS